MLFDTDFATVKLLRAYSHIKNSETQHSMVVFIETLADQYGSTAMKIMIIAACLLMAGPAAAEELTGQASVIDGDTIKISNTRVRLFGIDAPESDQACHDDDGKLYHCGQKAANELAKVIASTTVRCEVRNLDRYGRTITTCLAAGADLGDWMVSRGLALYWMQYSKGRYAAV